MGRRILQDTVRTQRTGPGHEKDEFEETHPAFGTARVNRRSGGGGLSLFQSDLQHNETVVLSVTRAVRIRSLHRDWVHPTTELIEIEMSLSQWGALVSSMGRGSGVPVTLRRTENEIFVPEIPFQPRIAQVVAETKGKVGEVLKHIREKFNDLQAVIDNKGGVKATREAARSLGFAIENADGNAAFAVKSVAETVEKVVDQGKADIEAHILQTAAAYGLPTTIEVPELGYERASVAPEIDVQQAIADAEDEDGEQS